MRREAREEHWDVAVIGAGPAGLAAAQAAREAGAERVLVLERDERAGGILNQCIHDGFGLLHYGETLTGPEYAVRARAEALAAGVEIRTGSMVTGLAPDRRITVVSRQGRTEIQAGAVVLATGCRERTRGALAIPGTRPAGVYTAGVVQNLVNCRNILPGKRVVLLGSGDIGLIMARRLTLEGAEVRCALEIRPEPSGLERNVSQCLYDFQIPLHVSHTVTRILGKKRVEAVEVAAVDGDGRPLPDTTRTIDCDTLLLSVGLIPENEVAKQAGVELDPATRGVRTDPYLQTTVPGIFACGNARAVTDLADLASRQGATAGANAAAFAGGAPLREGRPERDARLAKGFPRPDTVTCILCPLGCRVRLAADGTAEGHRCERGPVYSLQEKTAPRRILTTTVRTESGRLVPVRSREPVPKQELLPLVEELRRLVVPDAEDDLRAALGERYTTCLMLGSPA